MEIKQTTSIKTNETKKNLTPANIMEVSKLTDLPNTEPSLYKKNEYFTPAATSAPNSKIRKPRGYFEQLLAAKITIHPPAPIPELIAAKVQPKLIKQKNTPSPKNAKEPVVQNTELTGIQIKDARKLKGWSQGQLAGFLGVSQNLVSLIERDKRAISKKLRRKIGKLLEI